MKTIINEAAYNEATKRAIVNNARKTFDATYDPDRTLAVFLLDNQWSSFYVSLYSQLSEYGKLSEKQVNCVRKAMANSVAKKQSKIAEVAEKFENIICKDKCDVVACVISFEKGYYVVRYDDKLDGVYEKLSGAKTHAKRIVARHNFSYSFK